MQSQKHTTDITAGVHTTQTYIRLKQACKRFPVSEAQLRKLVLNRKIPYYKVGRLVYLAESDLEAMFLIGRVAPKTEAGRAN